MAASSMMRIILLAVHAVTTLASSSAAVNNYQPKVQVVEPFGHAMNSMSFPHGSPWCGDAVPTYWLLGHQSPEAPYCYINGNWTESNTVVLDDVDALTQSHNDISKHIDRHGCAAIDVNHDGLLDIVCIVGADQGLGAGYNELYMTQPNGSIAKILSGHGLQKYTSLRKYI
jgi:hypothetical protein